MASLFAGLNRVGLWDSLILPPGFADSELPEWRVFSLPETPSMESYVLVADLGKTYDGSVNHTFSLLACADWSVFAGMRGGPFKERAQLSAGSGGSATNLCRNPDEGPHPWCYTESEYVLRQTCNIPTCASARCGIVDPCLVAVAEEASGSAPACSTTTRWPEPTRAALPSVGDQLRSDDIAGAGEEAGVTLYEVGSMDATFSHAVLSLNASRASWLRAHFLHGAPCGVEGSAVSAGAHVPGSAMIEERSLFLVLGDLGAYRGREYSAMQVRRIPSASAAESACATDLASIGNSKFSPCVGGHGSNTQTSPDVVHWGVADDGENLYDGLGESIWLNAPEDFVYVPGPPIAGDARGRRALGVAYIADTGNNVIRRVDMSSLTMPTVTLAGSGAGRSGVSDGRRGEARFSRPRRITFVEGRNVLAVLCKGQVTDVRLINPITGDTATVDATLALSPVLFAEGAGTLSSLVDIASLGVSRVLLLVQSSQAAALSRSGPSDFLVSCELHTDGQGLDSCALQGPSGGATRLAAIRRDGEVVVLVGSSAGPVRVLSSDVTAEGVGAADTLDIQQQADNDGDGDGSKNDDTLGPVAIGLLGALALLAGVALAVYFQRRSKSNRELSGGSKHSITKASFAGDVEAAIKAEISPADIKAEITPADSIAGMPADWPEDLTSLRGLVIEPGEVEVHKLIGMGAQSIVHEGVWQSQRVALKLIPMRGEFRGGRAPHQVIREVAIHASCRHPNLLPVYGVVLGGMSEVDGVTVVCHLAECNLRQLLQRSRNLPADSARGLSWKARMKIALGIARGVHYLHTKGEGAAIVHRDLKPENVLVEVQNGEYVASIADFGMSKQAKGSIITTSDISMKGTLGYIAPELLLKELEREDDSEGGDDVTFGSVELKRADIYSLGAVLRDLLDVDGRREWMHTDKYFGDMIALQVAIRAELEAEGVGKGHSSGRSSPLRDLVRHAPEQPSLDDAGVAADGGQMDDATAFVRQQGRVPQPPGAPPELVLAVTLALLLRPASRHTSGDVVRVLEDGLARMSSRSTSRRGSGAGASRFAAEAASSSQAGE